MGALDLLDDAVCSEQTEEAGDLGAGAALWESVHDAGTAHRLELRYPWLAAAQLEWRCSADALGFGAGAKRRTRDGTQPHNFRISHSHGPRRPGHELAPITASSPKATVATNATTNGETEKLPARGTTTKYSSSTCSR